MGTYVHEMLHVVDNHSLKYDPETPLLHSYLNLDPEDVDTEKEKLAWYAKYMTATLPGGKGIDPRAYWQPSGKYTLITDDMTAGGLVDTSALPLDISGAKVSAIKNQTYTGKAIKPAVTITDGSYTLKKGVDYSVSYKNNKEAGTATATICGKGIYTGTISTTFKIVKKGAATNAPTVKATTTVKLTWDKVDGAGKYEVWYSTNDGEMKKYKTLASGTTSCSVKISTKNTYMFAVRAYISSTGEYTDYGYIDV